MQYQEINSTELIEIIFFFRQAVENIMEKPLEHLIFSLKKAISFQFINFYSVDQFKILIER